MSTPVDITDELPTAGRIVFLGDSITECGDYVADVECWLIAQGRQIEILNVGLSSETATELSSEENAGHLKQFGFDRPFVGERLARVLAETRPDWLFACYGMNDAGALPRNEQGMKRFTDAMTGLREAVFNSGATRVVICTPPVHDAKGDITKQFYDETLGRFADWLISRRRDGWEVVDIHTPMRTALHEHRSRDPAFSFAPDGVHPDRAGHWLMAREILTQYFGANLTAITCAEDLLPAHGHEIRSLVRARMEVRFDAWMSLICHQRPGVAGGPGLKKGPSLSAANVIATDYTRKIASLATGRNRPRQS